MASSKVQKPDETSSHPHEEHKLSQKMTVWGGKVFGHKHQEHQLGTKHCSTCQCPAPQKDTKTANADQVHKKQHATNVSVKDAKKEKEGHGTAAHKDAKNFTCLERKKKEKQHATNAVTKDPNQHTKSHTGNASNTLIHKEHKEEPANRWFSNMTDHLKEKIVIAKKAKDEKDKYRSSSSSDSDDEAGAKKKQKNKKQSHQTKPASK